MKILIISYGIYEYDGRLKELCDVMGHIDNYKLICLTNENKPDNTHKFINLKCKKQLSLKTYLHFIIQSIQLAYKSDGIDILVIDNMFASVPGLLIEKLFKPAFLIQDVRELYFFSEIKKLSGKFFSMMETYMMKKSDIILAANKQRSQIMYDHYGLKSKPLIFENIRFLPDDKFLSREILEKKYSEHFSYKYNLISTGGYSLTRKTVELVSSMKNLSQDFGLYIIGEGTQDDKHVIQDLIEQYSLENVHLLGKVPMGELKYILSKCNIGIVSYHENDLNNQYCASGKVYEYLAEGIPIVTTENIPLKEFCEEHNVGVADNNFFNGIRQVSDNLMIYNKNVGEFIKHISPTRYNYELAQNIVSILDIEDKNSNEN